MALALCCLGASSAQAATHPFLEASSLDGSTTPSGEFVKTCGVAVDSKGDTYVANSGKGVIDVFTSSGTYLTQIADANSPCALAVDSKGNVYALDTASSNVVMFAPTGGIFPPGSGQTYEAAATVDASGEAKGIAVNPANDHFLINEGTKVVERKSAAEGSGILNPSIGEGALTQGYGVGVWGASGAIYAASETGKVFVFDSTGTKLRATIDGEGRPGGTYGALSKVDIAVNQANGHVLVFDAAEATVDEFESTGPFVSQITHSFAAAEPSAIAVDPTEEASAGRVYVTSGSGAGSQVFAFGPLPTPTHRQLTALEPKGSETLPEELGEFKNAEGLATDSQGDLYVVSTGTNAIDVFVPEGKGLKFVTAISDANSPRGVAVDSKGNVYVTRPNASEAQKGVFEYPLTSSFPFGGATPTYGTPVKIDSYIGGEGGPGGIVVNPANDHLFVAHHEEIKEFNSAANGSGLLKSGIGVGLGSEFEGIDVYGKTGEIFVANHGVGTQGILGIEPATNERLVRIKGEGVSKKPDGPFPNSLHANVAVDQSNGHVYVMSEEGGKAYEFESSGAYVSTIQRPAPVGSVFAAHLAVDNSTGPHARDIFASGGLNGPKEVNAYSPAKYGEPPSAITGEATGAAGAAGEITLHGTVNPAGVAVETCRFEYVAKSKAEFEATGFAGVTNEPCAESEAEIGEGEAPVAVHADLAGLSAASRYYYRLYAKNVYGEDEGQAKRFGAPEVEGEEAPETLFTEAVITATVDPAGLETTYHCEYGPTAAYGTSTAEEAITGLEAAKAHCALFGLAQGTTYHYRVVATNAWSVTEGADQTFTTLSEPGGTCPNEQFRTGPSANLPDCRAYELVTPDLGSFYPTDLREGENAGGSSFPGPLASPDGEDLLYLGEATPPGAEGNGARNAYRAHRGAAGWTSALAGPTGAQIPKSNAGGTTPFHEYSFWESGQASAGSLPEGRYLRLPDGSFQPIGLGQESAVDLKAFGRYISEGGAHVIFSSTVQLAPGAPVAGKEGVYDRPASGTAQLISTPPPGASPAIEEEFAEDGAAYLNSSADGTTVAFEVGSTVYVHRDGTTREVGSGNIAFGGLSVDGSRLFYVQSPVPPANSKEVRRGEAFAYDTATETASPIGSGGESVLVNVSPDGSHVYFASRAVLEPGEENEAGEEAQASAENLYVWSSSGGARFIATVADADIEDPLSRAQRLGYWVSGMGPVFNSRIGPANDPSRTTPDGGALAFESLANLTSYDSKGHPEVYLYSPGEGVSCLSCNHLSPASAGARLQLLPEGSELRLTLLPTLPTTLIPNLSADGSTVFFETTEGLVPQDQNGVRDVYEWREGAVSLISSGTGTTQSFLFGASEDGRDVFFSTYETLTAADGDGGGISIYDARVGGGFPAPATEAPCRGAGECKGGSLGSAPSLSAPGSAAISGPGNAPSGTGRCPRGKHAVKKKGRIRCVAKHKKRHARHRRHHHNRHGKKKAGDGRGMGR